MSVMLFCLSQRDVILWPSDLTDFDVGVVVYSSFGAKNKKSQLDSSATHKSKC